MPAIVWAKSSKIGYLSRAWPAPTCCIYSLLSNYLVLKTLYIQLIYNKTGETVYYTGIPKIIDFMKVKGETYFMSEGKMYQMDKRHYGFDCGFRHLAKKQFYCVDNQWYCKTHIHGDEWSEEPCESPNKRKRNIVNIDVFSLKKIIQLEKQYLSELYINEVSVVGHPTTKQGIIGIADTQEVIKANTSPVTSLTMGVKEAENRQEEGGWKDARQNVVEMTFKAKRSETLNEKKQAIRERELAQWLDIKKGESGSYEPWRIGMTKAEIWGELGKTSKHFKAKSKETIKTFFRLQNLCGGFTDEVGRPPKNK